MTDFTTSNFSGGTHKLNISVGSTANAWASNTGKSRFAPDIRMTGSHIGANIWHDRPIMTTQTKGLVPKTTCNGMPIALGKMSPMPHQFLESPQVKKSFALPNNSNGRVSQLGASVDAVRAGVAWVTNHNFREASKEVYGNHPHQHSRTRSHGPGSFQLNLGSLPPHIVSPPTITNKAGMHHSKNPFGDTFKKGVLREDYNTVGFSVNGCGGPLIGNQNRRSQTIMVHPDSPSKTLGSIGWGHDIPALQQQIQARQLTDKPHMNAYNHGQLKNNLQMDTTGFKAQAMDEWLGIPYETLENLSVRQQREIIKKRAREIFQEDRAQRRMYSMIHTKPIDTATNTKIHFRKIENNLQRLTFEQLQAIARSEEKLGSAGSMQGPSHLVSEMTPHHGRNVTIDRPINVQQKLYSVKGGTEVSSYVDDATTNARTTAGGMGYATDESPLPRLNRGVNSSVGHTTEEKMRHGSKYNQTADLQSVIEDQQNLPARLMYETMPHNKRMLQKGCPRLLRMVKQHKEELLDCAGLSSNGFSSQALSQTRKGGQSKNWSVFHQKQQAMDALFERYKASFMTTRDGRNKSNLQYEDDQMMAHYQEHPNGQKNTFSGPLQIKKALNNAGPLSPVAGKASQNLPQMDHSQHPIRSNGDRYYSPDENASTEQQPIKMHNDLQEQSEVPQDSILQRDELPGSLMATPMQGGSSQNNEYATTGKQVNSVDTVQHTADTTMQGISVQSPPKEMKDGIAEEGEESDQ